MSKGSVGYRPEVDGLRAIAVVGVIIYHAEIFLAGRMMLPGGYLGVDVFFVISGYLITRLILAELRETDRFSFLHFYERRARRILPALFMVILVSVPVAMVLYASAPSKFIDFAHSVIASVLFSSNFFFYFSATTYAAEDSLLHPFLHTWSLGVEEQFYLFFPVLAIFMFKFMRQHILAVILVMILLGLQFAELMSTRQEDLNFYLPMSRFWELFVGSAIAQIELSHGRVRNALANTILPVLGAAMIAWSMVFLPDHVPHPSKLTLLTVLGAALIIMFANTEDLIGQILGSKPIVFVGLISYSAYLIHFPLMAFWRVADPSIALYEQVLWIVLSLALAALSYRFVEQPFRQSGRVGVKALVSSGIGAIAVFCAALFFAYPDISRFEADARENPELVMDQGGYLKYWTDAKIQMGKTSFTQGDRVNVLIVGDSHATDLYSALAQNADRFPTYDFAITHADNPTARSSHYEAYCLGYNFFARGDETCEGTRFSLAEKYAQADVVMLATHWNQGDLNVLDAMHQRVVADGKKFVLVSNNVEIRETRPVRAFIGREGRFPAGEEIAQIEREIFAYIAGDPIVSEVNATLSAFAQDNDVPYLIKHDIFCDDALERCKLFTPDNDILHWDYAHFTVNGARYVGGLIADQGWLNLDRDQ